MMDERRVERELYIIAATDHKVIDSERERIVKKAFKWALENKVFDETPASLGGIPEFYLTYTMLKGYRRFAILLTNLARGIQDGVIEVPKD